MAKVKKQLSNALLPWALPVLLVVVWQIASQAGWLSTRILPSPENIVITFWHLAASGELWQHLAISGWRAAIGFAIGGSIGLILGLITGTSRTGERLLDTSVQMLRNVPHLALIPLVILWFGIDESAKIFLVALGTLFYFLDLPVLVWASAALLVVGLIVGWVMKRAGYGVGGAKYTPKQH